MLLPLLLAAARAHDPDACSQVQAVRSQAIAAQLDTATLDTLAARLCGGSGYSPPRGGGGGGSMCREAQQIALVAKIGGSSGSELGQVERIRDLACDGTIEGNFSWPNGVQGRRVDGSWSYPNAILARGSDGSLHYPNAILARGTDGSWHYPGAILAKGTDGRWYRPDATYVGSAGDLLAWACDRKPSRCDAVRQAMRSGDSLWADAALVGFAWEAR